MTEKILTKFFKRYASYMYDNNDRVPYVRSINAHYGNGAFVYRDKKLALCIYLPTVYPVLLLTIRDSYIYPKGALFYTYLF